VPIRSVILTIGAAAAIAAGFHAEYSLLEQELDLLFDLIAMRLVTSVTLSAQRKEKTADNPYLLVSEAPAWALLRRVDAILGRIDVIGHELYPTVDPLLDGATACGLLTAPLLPEGHFALSPPKTAYDSASGDYNCKSIR
jgi:hypothetical protein